MSSIAIGAPNRLGQRLRRQHGGLRTGRRDSSLAQQDDALDLGDDFVDVVRDQDERRAVAGDLPDALHEIVPRDQVEAGRRLVEDQRPRRRDERARQQHAPRFAARHLVQPAPGQVRRAHALERVGRPSAHLVGDRAVAQDAVRREKAGEHRGLARDAALAVAGDEPLMQIGRHDAELRSQLEHVPVVVAEHADRRLRRRRRRARGPRA